MTAAEILASLVGFDTTSRNSNLPLVEWVESYLGELGVCSERIHGEDRTKANLLARIGPEAPGGLVLCGHMDTVPVDGQPWTADPFTLTRKDGRLLGRGTVDMKGFLACALAAVPAMKASDLRRPIWLAFTYDEEVGCLGAPPLVERLADGRLRPELVIVGEPTGMQLVRAHKGVRVFRTTVTGKAAHSSQPGHGANAIVAAARLATFIADLALERRSAGPQAPGYAPPHTTFNVGIIEGGEALNIIARSCLMTWEFRFVPGEDADALQERVEAFARDKILPELLATAPGAAIEFELLAQVPVLDPASNAGAAELLQSITHLPELSAVSYGTDGALFAAAGLPTVVIGPGSIDQMHEPDESISEDELAAGDSFLSHLISWSATS